MIANQILLNIIIRVGMITLSCLVFGFVYVGFNDIFINLNFIVFIVLQTILLIRKLNITNNTLSHFFNSIQFDDASLVLKNRTHWKSFQNLLNSLDSLNEKINTLKSKSAGQEAWFENLVENVNIGLISIDDNNRILLFNPAARRLLKHTEKTPPLRFDISFPELNQSIQDQRPAEQKLVKMSVGKDVLHLAVVQNPIKVLDQKTRLISLQNIRSELEEKELETWQKMIRVLTHEIMNSIGPISSTINTINDFLTADQKNNKTIPANITNETIEDVVKGLQIIKERSAGLVDFVNTFRTLTLLSKSQAQAIRITELFNDVGLLMRKELSDKKISLTVSVEPEDITLNADPNLLQQMFINIINNSIDALTDTSNPAISFIAFLLDEKVIIEITDNGKGIPADQLEDIFIPFFSTKEEGSGIGLSLSRQIMRLHGGTISVQSIPYKETNVRLNF